MSGTEKKQAGGPDVVGAARGASRWFAALAVYDGLATLALVLIALLALSQGAVVFAVAALAFSSLFGWLGYLKVAAGWKIRSGIETKDGQAFATGFKYVRTLLIWAFAGNVVLLMQQVSCHSGAS